MSIDLSKRCKLTPEELVAGVANVIAIYEQMSFRKKHLTLAKEIQAEVVRLANNTPAPNQTRAILNYLTGQLTELIERGSLTLLMLLTSFTCDALQFSIEYNFKRELAVRHAFGGSQLYNWLSGKPLNPLPTVIRVPIYGYFLGNLLVVAIGGAISGVAGPALIAALIPCLASLALAAVIVEMFVGLYPALCEVMPVRNQVDLNVRSFNIALASALALLDTNHIYTPDNIAAIEKHPSPINIAYALRRLDHNRLLTQDNFNKVILLSKLQLLPTLIEKAPYSSQEDFDAFFKRQQALIQTNFEFNDDGVDSLKFFTAKAVNEYLPTDTVDQQTTDVREILNATKLCSYK